MNMKKWYKQKCILLLAGILLFSFVSVNHSMDVQAASKNYMKKMHVSWDLKKGKTVTYKTNYAGIGMRKLKAKIADYKIEDYGKTGYKKLTFTVQFEMGKKFKPKEIHKMCNSKHYKKNHGTGDIVVHIIDYNTGKKLTIENPYGVTIRNAGWKNLKTRKEEDKDGCCTYGFKKSVSYTVIYPKSYKGLCIGFSGVTSLTTKKNDTRYMNGQAVFGKTSFFSKKDKSIAHFMRVK